MLSATPSGQVAGCALLADASTVGLDGESSQSASGTLSEHSIIAERRWANRLPDEEAIGWFGAAVWLLNAVAAATHTLDAWWVIGINGLVAAAGLAWGVLDARAHGVGSSNAAVAFGMPTFAASLYASLTLWPELTGLAMAIASVTYVVVGAVCVGVVDGERRPDGRLDWHLIPYSLRPRRPIFMWSDKALLGHVRRVFVSADESTVAAVVVFHQDPALLPNWVGERDPEFRPWLVLSYFADEHAIVGWSYGVVEPVHNGSEGFATEGEALNYVATVARRRGMQERAVSELSPFLRAMVVQSLTGRQPPSD
jgi:hypothetical protein